MEKLYNELREFAKKKMDEVDKINCEKFDDYEESLIYFLREFGKDLIKCWVEKVENKIHTEPKCSKCGSDLKVKNYIEMYWYSCFGKVKAEDNYYQSDSCKNYERIFSDRIGKRTSEKSKKLKRALSDFGSEHSFGKAKKMFKEHYGIEYDRTLIERETYNVGEEAEKFVREKLEKGFSDSYFKTREGCETMLVEIDGSMIPTGEFKKSEKKTAVTDKRKIKRKTKKTEWKEVRLTVVENEKGERLYNAALEHSQQVGKNARGLAYINGMGQKTEIISINDGARWIEKEIKEKFNNLTFVIDRYHLSEYFHDAITDACTWEESRKNK